MNATEAWQCSHCGKFFPDQDDAESCCQPKPEPNKPLDFVQLKADARRLTHYYPPSCPEEAAGRRRILDAAPCLIDIAERCQNMECDSSDYWREKCIEWRDKCKDTEKERDRLLKAVEPFAALAKRIPANWPEQCPLRIDSGTNTKGRWYEWMAYHGVDDNGTPAHCVALLPTIGQWRALTCGG